MIEEEAPTKHIFPDEPQNPETNLWFCFNLATRGYRFYDLHKHTFPRPQKAYGKCKDGTDLTVHFECPQVIDKSGLFNMFKNDILRLKSIVNGNDNRYERHLIRRYEGWKRSVLKGETEIIRAMDVHNLLA